MPKKAAPVAEAAVITVKRHEKRAFFKRPGRKTEMTAKTAPPSTQ
jgi:hypothetical protein